MSISAQRLEKLWYEPPRLAYALAPISLAYRWLTGARRALYRHGIFGTTRLGVPVVVIGNITAGGTGKTPLTVWLAQALAAAGLKPGVVCKSYAASASTPCLVTADDDPRVRGDEAVLIASRLSCPVWSGPDRVAVGGALLAAHAEVDVVVCDDGLQHYALERDVEIAVVDATRGFGNQLCLPAGPLREPRCRLRQVDAVVLNGAGNVSGIPGHAPRFRMTLKGERLRNLADPSRTASAAELVGKRVAAVAGIGNPQRFFDHLRGLGLDFSAHPFPDHHPFRAAELALTGAEAVVMTEKDAIKCRRLRDERIWVLPVSAQLDGELPKLVLGRLGRAPHASSAPHVPSLGEPL